MSFTHPQSPHLRPCSRLAHRPLDCDHMLSIFANGSSLMTLAHRVGPLLEPNRTPGIGAEAHASLRIFAPRALCPGS